MAPRIFIKGRGTEINEAFFEADSAMHSLIRQQWQTDGANTVLARFRFHECGLVFAFRRDVAGPLWVAKRVESELGRRRLRNEWQALETLAPWQEMLRIPRVLAWKEDERDACLILAGLPGCSRYPALRKGSAVDAHFGLAQNWLREFHRLVPAPGGVDLPRLQQSCLQELNELPQRERRSHGLWAKFEQIVAPARPAVPVHNDFWWGNLLFEGGRVSVVDWDGFRAGTPLDDLLTLLLKTPAFRGWSRLSAAEAFHWMFFEKSSVHRLLQGWVSEYGLSAGDAEFCFYSFLVRRLHWELGMSLQPRGERDRRSAQVEWSAILGWLAEHSYPNPFAPR